MRNIIFTIFALIDVTLFYYFMKRTFSLKKQREVHALIFLSVFISIAYIYIVNMRAFLFVYMIFMLYSYVAFEISLVKSITITIVYFMIYICSFMISFFIVDVTYHVTLTDILMHSNLRVLSSAINEIVKYGLITISISFINLRKRKLRLPALCVFIILPISTLFIMLGSTNYLSQSYEFNTTFLLGTVGLLITNVGMIYIVDRIVKGNEISKKYHALKYRKEYEHEYLQMLERYREDTRVYMHDFYKHIRMINELFHEHKEKELEQYLSDLTTDTKQIKMQYQSGIKELDIILNGYTQQLLTYHITLHLHVQPMDISWLKLTDFNTMITNLLDNALESCIKCKGKMICLEIVEFGEQCIRIKLENDCNEVVMNNNIYVTSKNDCEHHGLGLSSIERIANSYNGTCIFDFKKEDQKFVSIVILEKISEYI